MTLNLTKITNDDFIQIKPHSYLLIGRRQTGKTFACKYLINQHKCATTIICPNYIKGIHDQYSDITCIKYKEFDNQIIENMKNTAKEFKKENGYFFPMLLVLDDCLSNNMKYNDKLDNLFSTARHYNISIIMITQYVAYASSTIRNNSDYIFVFPNLKTNLLNDIIPKKINIKEVWKEKYRFLICDYSSYTTKYYNYKISLPKYKCPKSKKNQKISKKKI